MGTINSHTAEADFLGSYQRALRRHLALGTAPNLAATTRLGRQAVGLGLEPLDVAALHERALVSLAVRDASARPDRSGLGRAARFFAEVIVPIEATHRAARRRDDRVVQLTRALRQRTAESSAVGRRLKETVAQRRRSEASLKQVGIRRARLMRRSQELQTRLRQQMRRILAVQEEQKRQGSRQLRDELVQTLVAIHVRLLTLRQAAKAGTDSLKNEVAETQRLVKQSAQTIQRLVLAFGVDHET